jgi:hypothetical protein
MPKTFITERDIEDLAHQGRMELALSDDIVLTDLAYEKACRLGVKLLQRHSQPPAAPSRPYLSEPPVESQKTSESTSTVNSIQDKPCGQCLIPDDPSNGELKRRVIEAVTTRLGGQVDRALLSTIVERVFADLGVH